MITILLMLLWFVVAVILVSANGVDNYYSKTWKKVLYYVVGAPYLIALFVKQKISGRICLSQFLLWLHN